MIPAPKMPLPHPELTLKETDMKRTRVNIRCVANVAAIRREKLNGRDVVIVPSATLPDDIVMNDIAYPADEIAKSYKSLERTPAPLGHPTINGKFVSASDPEGINLGWIGAWNANVRQETMPNGKRRVLLDKVIDVERAGQSDGGKAVLNAIDKGDPVHTSTGLYCTLEAATGDVPYKFIARNMEFDHDAILTDQEGAATPEQGVGMMVNAKGEQEEIEVINSAYTQADQDLDWAVASIASALEKRQRAPLLDKLKTAISEMFDKLSATERTTPTNKKDDDMAVSDEQFNALSGEVKTLSEAVKNMAADQGKIAETVATAVANAVKPLTDAHNAMVANQKAKDDAEAADLAAKVVKANLLTEDAAKATPLNTLRELAKLAEPGKAANLNRSFGGGEGDDEFKDYGLDAINNLMEVK